MSDKFVNIFTESTKALTKGAGFSFLIKSCGLGTAFLFNLLVAHFLGVEGTGLYFLSVTITTICLTLTRFGLDGALLKYVSIYTSSCEADKLKGVLQKSFLLMSVASVLVVLFVSVFGDWLSAVVFHSEELTMPMKIMVVSVLPLSVGFLSSEVLRGVGETKKYLFLNALCHPVLLLVCFYFFGRNTGLNGLAYIYLATAFIYSLISFSLLRTSPKLRFDGIKGCFPMQMLLKSALPLLWTTLFHQFINWIPILVLGVFATVDDVGRFGISMRIATLLSVFLFSVNSVVAPQMAPLYEAKDLHGLNTLFKNAQKLLRVVVTPVVVVMMVFSAYILGLFGDAFAGSAVLLIVLLSGQYLSVFCGPVNYCLMMTGHENALFRIISFTTIPTVLLNLFLIKSFGAIGAAVATAMSIAIQNFSAGYLVHRHLKIRVLP